MRIEAKGLAELIERMKARTDRVERLQPAFEFFGERIVKKTDDGFNRETNWDGSAFAPLADSTILNRISSIGSANKYTASSTKKHDAARSALKSATPEQKAAALQNLLAAGWSPKQARALINFRHAHTFDASGKYKRVSKRLTKRAQEMRSKMLAPGGVKPLIDTARARNSNHIDDLKPTSVRWSAVGYLRFHMTGTGRIPKRNPTPFNYAGDGKWEFAQDAGEDLDATLTAYIKNGDPDYGAT